MTKKNDCMPHQKPKKIGVLLVNLGTPAAPSATAIRTYLREFLSDQRVVELPRLIWLPILYGFILPFRPMKLKKNYQDIWLKKGSPLLVHSLNLLKKLSQHSKTKSYHFEFAFRYGDPSIKNAFDNFADANCHKVIVLPLYPQYSATTTGATFDAIADVLKKKRFIPELHFLNHYADHPNYIKLLANQIKDYIDAKGPPDQFVFSFHGLPKINLEKGDPYYCYCHKTARLVAEAAKLSKEQWLLTFQSRFGRAAWLQPYTLETMTVLANEGKKHIAVLCPGFSADCLETLEEINIQNKTAFLDAGGKRFDYIPCLNDNEGHVDFFADWISNL